MKELRWSPLLSKGSQSPGRRRGRVKEEREEKQEKEEYRSDSVR